MTDEFRTHGADSAINDEAAETPAIDPTLLGQVQGHCSEDDGVPDVGTTIGLGGGSMLWIGEILRADGGDIGIVFHGHDGMRIAAALWPNCDWQEAADILRDHVAPLLRAARSPAVASTDMAGAEDEWGKRLDWDGNAQIAQDAYDTLTAPPVEGLTSGEGDTVAFVQDWMMSGDHEPSKWEREFAAAIDARSSPKATATASVREPSGLKLAAQIANLRGHAHDVIEQHSRSAPAVKLARAVLALDSGIAATIGQQGGGKE